MILLALYSWIHLKHIYCFKSMHLYYWISPPFFTTDFHSEEKCFKNLKVTVIRLYIRNFVMMKRNESKTAIKTAFIRCKGYFSRFYFLHCMILQILGRFWILNLIWKAINISLLDVQTLYLKPLYWGSYCNIRTPYI